MLQQKHWHGGHKSESIGTCKSQQIWNGTRGPRPSKKQTTSQTNNGLDHPLLRRTAKISRAEMNTSDIWEISVDRAHLKQNANRFITTRQCSGEPPPAKNDDHRGGADGGLTTQDGLTKQQPKAHTEHNSGEPADHRRTPEPPANHHSFRTATNQEPNFNSGNKTAGKKKGQSTHQPAIEALEKLWDQTSNKNRGLCKWADKHPPPRRRRCLLTKSEPKNTNPERNWFILRVTDLETGGAEGQRRSLHHHR
jgi:hypothetical protein